MLQSQEIKDLAAALSKAQAEIRGAIKDSNNPFFKATYADLASVIEAIKEPLANNGLSVTQMCDCDLDDPKKLVIETQIMHSSGQWLRGKLPVKCKDDSPQSQGSGISYARRYALMAALNVPALDDDAETAQAAYRKQVEPKLSASQLVDPPRQLTKAPEVLNPQRSLEPPPLMGMTAAIQEIDTTPLRREVSVLMKKKGLTTETVRALAEKLCGKKTTYSMTVEELKKLISEINK